MGDVFLFLILVLIFVGIVTHEGFIFILLYLFIGTFLFSFGWLRRVIEKVHLKRNFTDRAFVGEEIDIEVLVQNHSRLPALYLQFEEDTPPELSGTQLAQQVISVQGRKEGRIRYKLRTHKRGLYAVGPARVISGDLLGLVKEQRKVLQPSPITIYPRVLPLDRLGLPMQAPLGNLKHKNPIFEDPSRVIGKREYQPGDPFRRIDWKSTASSGTLQTRVYQPSIDLNTTIFLDLDKRSYQDRNRYQANEFAIVVAASLVNWIIEQKQSVGFITNGADPLATNGRLQIVPPQKGQPQLMEVLEVLARIDANEEIPLIPMLQQGAGGLSWGTTVMIITGQVKTTLLEALLPMQRKGLNPVLISCGTGVGGGDVAPIAKAIHLPYYTLRHELELDQLGRDG